MKCLVLIVCFLMSLAAESTAQLELHGRIKEYHDREYLNIENGTILVLNTGLRAEINTNGEFFIFGRDVPKGDSLHIMATQLGFKSKVIALPIKGLNLNRYINYDLVRFRLDSLDNNGDKICGRVVDNETKKPLAGVDIKLVDHEDRNIQSDFNGYFGFFTKNKKSIEIWFHKSGYKIKRQLLILDSYKGCESETLRIELSKLETNPPRLISFLFKDSSGAILPEVHLFINGSYVNKSSKLDTLKLILDYPSQDSINVKYFYSKTTDGQTNTYGNEKFFHFDKLKKLEIIQIDSYNQIHPEATEKITRKSAVLNKLKVIVLESGTNRRIAGATVKLDHCPDDVTYSDTMGIAVFEHPCAGRYLSVETSEHEPWQEQLPKELSECVVWLKREVRRIEISAFNRTDSTKIPNPILFSEQGRLYKIGASNHILIHHITKENPLKVTAQDYNILSLLPESLNSSQLVFLMPKSTRQSGSNFSGYFGVVFFRFTKSEKVGNKTSILINNSHFCAFNIYLEKQITSWRPGTPSKGVALRTFWQMQSPTQELIKMDLGLDLLIKEQKRFSFTTGIHMSLYDLNITDSPGSDIRKSWLTPFFSLGVEIVASPQWLKRIASRGIELRIWREGLIIDHYRLSSTQFKLSNLRNFVPPRVGWHGNITLKNHFGIIKIAGAILSPAIETRYGKLKFKPIVSLSYGFDL